MAIDQFNVRLPNASILLHDFLLLCFIMLIRVSFQYLNSVL